MEYLCIKELYSTQCLYFELNQLSSDLSLQYGVRYFRSGFKYTKTNLGPDTDFSYLLNALTHELGINLAMRPQVNFEADLNVAFNWIRQRFDEGS